MLHPRKPVYILSHAWSTGEHTLWSEHLFKNTGHNYARMIFHKTTNMPNLTPELAKAVLTEVLSALNTAENVQKLSEAKENSGNEMLKMMQFVFPIVTQIQMDVIKNYGFPEGREGVVQFAQLLRTLERDDPEVAQLHGQVRSYFLPSVTISSSIDASL